MPIDAHLTLKTTTTTTSRPAPDGTQAVRRPAQAAQYEQLMRRMSNGNTNWRMQDDDNESTGESDLLAAKPTRRRRRDQPQDEATADASAEFQLMSRSTSGRFEPISTSMRDAFATSHRQQRRDRDERLHNLSNGDGAQASSACRTSSTLNRPIRQMSTNSHNERTDLHKMDPQQQHQQQETSIARYNSNGLYSQPASGQPSLSSTASQQNTTGTATTSSSAIDEHSTNEYLDAQRHRESAMLDEGCQQQHETQQSSDMEAQMRDLIANKGDEQHFYCDVTGDSLKRIRDEQQRVIYDHQLRASLVKQQQQQQNLVFSTNQRPNSTYKRPATLTLNQSYQRLVEKLNEGIVHPQANACELFRRDEPLYHSQFYRQPPYYADQTIQRPIHSQAGSFFFPNQLRSPVFESSTGRRRKSSSNSSDNYQQPMGLEKEPEEASNWIHYSVLALCGLLLILGLFALVLPIYTRISYWTSGANTDPSEQLMKAPTPQLDSLLQNSSRTPPGASFPFGPNQLANAGLQSPPIGSDGDSLSRSNSLPFPFAVPNNVIKQQQQPNSITTDELAKWTTSTTQRPANQLEASTQSYWGARARRLELDEQEVNGEEASFCAPPRACSGNGECLEQAACACLAAHSGPTCSIVNCPNGCSRHGECKLLASWPLNNLAAHRDASLGFQSTSSAKWRLSSCLATTDAQPRLTNRSLTASQPLSWSNRRPQLFDNRLQWACECEPGFKGRDCSQLRELSCDDHKDNDQDGLTDCEDDDCCGLPVCRASSCLEPSDWNHALMLARASSATERQLDELLHPSNVSSTIGGHHLAEWNFLIASNSTQRYAKRDIYDRHRVAIVRGRVTNALQNPWPGVRVGVAEWGEFGYTVTNRDGFFDLLVNGDAWLTLQFHSTYLSHRRRVFVRARAINQLDSDVLIAADDRKQLPVGGELEVGLRPRAPFQLGANFELYRLIEQFKQRDHDERHQAKLFFCLAENLLKPIRMAAQNSPLIQSLEPRVLLDTQQPSQLRPFALISPAATSFTTQLNASDDETPLQLVYNSANFPPASSVVKPTVSIELLPSSYMQIAQSSSNFQLASITVQLDIEGQTRREHFADNQLVGGLSYQFAWNRRDVYERKIYGFGRLNVRVEYEFKFGVQSGQEARRKIDETLNLCVAGDRSESEEMRQSLAGLSGELSRRLVTQETSVHMEAHQMNQHADLGQWALDWSSRLDLERNLIYFSSGPTLPLTLAYPPVLANPMALIQKRQHSLERVKDNGHGKRLMTRGPDSSMFVLLVESDKNIKSNRLLLLDASGTRRLLDVPLASLTSKFQSAAPPQWVLDDFQLVYNNLDSTLYISSRSAANIVQVSLQSLKVLSRSSSSATPAASADDEVSIEPLCGFSKGELVGVAPSSGSLRPCKSMRLQRPHSMALDERNRLLYFVDGTTSLIVLDLATNLALNLVWSLPAPAIQRQLFGSLEALTRDSHANCLGLGARLPPGDILISANKLHSLVWSEADSSLYMVLADSVVLALRPDANFEIVALGANSANYRISSASFNTQLAAPSGFHFCATNSDSQLGSIKTLALDQTHGHELVIVHQWLQQQTSSFQSPQLNGDSAKRAGHFYLAKMPLGIPSGSQAQRTKVWRTRHPKPLFDLHSAESTWNPLVGQFAPSVVNSSAPTPIIDWRHAARMPTRLNQMKNYQMAGSQSVPDDGEIRFLHLSGGLTQIDSLEINSDGSIFVLDAHQQSIQLIGAYSPAQFNLLDQPEWGLERRFVGASQVSSASERPFRRLLLPNPLQSNELLEFHYTSGLLLSRSQVDGGARLDFFYRVLSNAAHKVDGSRPLDEDDANDLESKRLALELDQSTPLSQPHRQARLLASANSFIRLNKIEMISRRNGDELKTEFEMVRSYAGSRYALQSIKRNHKLISEITTDRLGALITFIRQPNTKTNWTELVYDPKTYLLQNVITKSTTRNRDSTQPSAMVQSIMLFSADDRLDRSTKRIIYDEVFNHYCDLFTVDS